MAFDQRGLDDYIDVPSRIAEFRERYPEGSLQPADPHKPFEIQQVSGTDKNGKDITGTFIIYTAAAYRTPDDQRPGIGMAWEVFPGRTPYTAGSELMNAETSAWGRAIVAALASDSKRGVSSREEVRNRSAEQDESWRDKPPVNRQQRQQEPKPAQDADSSQWETPPAGPVTDMDWMTDLVDTKIPAATDKKTLDKYWAESVRKHEAGECTAEHGKQIQVFITERAKELGLPEKAKAAAQAKADAAANGKTPEPVSP